MDYGIFVHALLKTPADFVLKVVLNSLNITVRLDNKAVLFGILGRENMSGLVNYILLKSKYFIYRCKLNNDSLCIRLLVDKFKKNIWNRTYVFNREKEPQTPFPR